jgi:hypothetical protein
LGIKQEKGEAAEMIAMQVREQDHRYVIGRYPIATYADQSRSAAVEQQRAGRGFDPDTRLQAPTTAKGISAA